MGRVRLGGIPFVWARVIKHVYTQNKKHYNRLNHAEEPGLRGTSDVRRHGVEHPVIVFVCTNEA